MIKEIRIGMDDVIAYPAEDWSLIGLLAERGFPVEPTVEGYDLKPKAGLKYFEFHDYKTDEIVVQWDE